MEVVEARVEEMEEVEVEVMEEEEVGEVEVEEDRIIFLMLTFHPKTFQT